MPSATTSNFLYNKQMNYLLHNTAWTAPTSIFIALFTGAPALDGTGGTEVPNSATGYARVAITNGGWSGPSGSNLEYSNTSDVQFGTPTATWGSISAAGLYDSAIGGSNELLFVAYLTVSKQVNNGDGAPKILAGQLRITRATC